MTSRWWGRGAPSFVDTARNNSTGTGSDYESTPDRKPCGQSLLRNGELFFLKSNFMNIYREDVEDKENGGATNHLTAAGQKNRVNIQNERTVTRRADRRGDAKSETLHFHIIGRYSERKCGDYFKERKRSDESHNFRVNFGNFSRCN